MKKVLLAGAILSIVMTLLTGCSGSDKSTLQEQIQQQQEKITSLLTASQQQEAEIDQLQKDAEQLKNQKSQLSAQISGLSSTISVLNGEIQSLTDDKEILNTALYQAQKEIETLKAATPPNIASLSAQIASLVTQMQQVQTEKDRLNYEVARLTKELTASPDHSYSWTEIITDPSLRSTAWAGKDYEWHDKIKEIGRTYHATHIYITGETDCDDMAVDIWNMLLAQSILSVIVVGNLENPNATFSEANHAWLVVYNSESRWAVLEPTTGEIIYGLNVDGTPNSKIDPYRSSGWAYKKPSDLWQDVKKKW